MFEDEIADLRIKCGNFLCITADVELNVTLNHTVHNLARLIKYLLKRHRIGLGVETGQRCGSLHHKHLLYG